MGKLILLMGPTGAGKSSQGDLLAQELGGVHLSSGKLLRDDPRAAAMLEDGRLAPAEEVHRVVGEAIAKAPADVPVILDGTPRTQSDLDWMAGNLARLGRMVERVILLELDYETSLKRLSGRDRSDDAPAAIRRKYEWFAEQTKPVVDYYEQRGLLRRVDGRGTLEEVFELVKAALK